MGTHTGSEGRHALQQELCSRGYKLVEGHAETRARGQHYLGAETRNEEKEEMINYGQMFKNREEARKGHP